MAATKFRARFATAGRINPVEQWLGLNIEGAWSIKMDSVSDDMRKKNYSLYFENSDDRDSFRRRFILGKAAYENKPEEAKKGLFSGLFGKSKKT